jgi:type I restriction enzyme, S subunit
MAGSIPLGWRQARYSEIMTECEDRAGSASEAPVLSVTKSRGPMLASERFGKRLHSLDLSRYRVARRGQVVADPMLLWDGSIGLQRVVDVGLVSPDYRVYEPSGAVDAEWLGYLIRSQQVRPHYAGGARGTNVRRNRISRSDFLTVPFLLPPLVEQRRIAVVLASVDDAIEKTEAVIAQIEAVKKALMTDLLTRGVPGRHTNVKPSEFGNMPLTWDLLPLGECLREPIRNGFSAHAAGLDTGFWIAHVGAVSARGFVEQAIKPVELTERVERCRLHVGDLLVSRSNTRERVGLASVYRGRPSWCAYPDLLMRVRPSSRLSPDFLELLLLSEGCREYFSRCARGTSESMVKIEGEILRACPIRLPPTEEQTEIVSLARAVDGRRVSEEQQLHALRRVKTGLLNGLLSGDVRALPSEEAA